LQFREFRRLTDLFLSFSFTAVSTIG